MIILDWGGQQSKGFEENLDKPAISLNTYTLFSGLQFLIFWECICFIEHTEFFLFKLGHSVV